MQDVDELFWSCPIHILALKTYRRYLSTTCGIVRLEWTMPFLHFGNVCYPIVSPTTGFPTKGNLKLMPRTWQTMERLVTALGYSSWHMIDCLGVFNVLLSNILAVQYCLYMKKSNLVHVM